MEALKIILLVGFVIRPIQIMIILYLAFIQWRELHVKTSYQPIKRLLFILFLANAFVYSFSLFIDMVGLFHWFSDKGLLFLTSYLAVNVLSAMLITIVLLIIYKLRIKE